MALVDLKKRFGAELKRRRMESGITQERLAELADLHRTYISAVESGKRNLTLVSIQRLAQALGASVASFFAAVEGVPEETFTGETLVKDAPLGANAYLIKPLDFHRFAEVTPKLRFRWALL